MTPNYTSSSIGFSIVNMSVDNSETVAINGTSFVVVEDYISPTSVGFLINNATYNLEVGQNVTIAADPAYYVELTNISYIPIKHTASLQILHNVTAPNYTETQPAALQSSSLSVSDVEPGKAIFDSGILQMTVTSKQSVLQSVTITVNKLNWALPGLQSNKLIYSFNVSVSPSSVQTNATFRYSCSLPSNSISPYLLSSNSVWAKITPFSVNSMACTVTFEVPSDPVVGIFEASNVITNETTASTSSTLASTSTLSTTTVPPTTTIKQAQPSEAINYYYYIVAAFVIALAAFAAFVLSRRRRGGGKDQPKPWVDASQPSQTSMQGPVQPPAPPGDQGTPPDAPADA